MSKTSAHERAKHARRTNKTRMKKEPHESNPRGTNLFYLCFFKKSMGKIPWKYRRTNKRIKSNDFYSFLFYFLMDLILLLVRRYFQGIFSIDFYIICRGHLSLCDTNKIFLIIFKTQLVLNQCRGPRLGGYLRRCWECRYRGWQKWPWRST